MKFYNKPTTVFDKYEPISDSFIFFMGKRQNSHIGLTTIFWIIQILHMRYNYDKYSL
jgi:hypothetical protein